MVVIGIFIEQFVLKKEQKGNQGKERRENTS